MARVGAEAPLFHGGDGEIKIVGQECPTHTDIAGLSNLRLALQDLSLNAALKRRSTFIALLIDAAMNGNGTHTSTYTPVGQWLPDADLP